MIRSSALRAPGSSPRRASDLSPPSRLGAKVHRLLPPCRDHLRCPVRLVGSTQRRISQRVLRPEVSRPTWRVDAAPHSAARFARVAAPPPTRSIRLPARWTRGRRGSRRPPPFPRPTEAPRASESSRPPLRTDRARPPVEGRTPPASPRAARAKHSSPPSPGHSSTWRRTPVDLGARPRAKRGLRRAASTKRPATQI